MKWFDYSAPRTLDEALDTYASHPHARLLAGGTDLLVQMRAGRKETDLVIDTKRIPELNELHCNGALTLGAAVPCCRIYEDAAVKSAFPALAAVASIIGGIQIQGRASIGGNLCNAAPSADSIPLLIALGATARIVYKGGERSVPVEDFCTAPGQNILQPGELLVSIQIPKPEPHSGSHYLRFIPRNEMDIAVAGAGVAVTLNGGTITAARIALASVAPTPLFVKAAGDALVGQPATEESVNKAALLAKDAAKPISDMRGTADYRRHLCAVLTRRALRAAIVQAQEA
ncbi:MAG: xanthine dehydrogenase family protein subunit M [Acidobacteria bacterium]|nr:xanthine dehydrogenase family protein subunit M [Acidobacteriota bacterium]